MDLKSPCVCVAMLMFWSGGAKGESQSGTTYYVDSAGGNDRNAGTSPGRAWKSVEQVNRATFGPGDHIFFKAGTVYAGHLQPRGSGVAGHSIIIDQFGIGAKPRIDGEGLNRETLLLYNVEYWEVNNLEITNTGQTREPFRAGVRVKLENFGTGHHIHLKNLFVRDVNGSNVKNLGGGTGITCENSGARVKSRFDDLLIERCHLLRTDRDGVAIRSENNERGTNWHPSLRVVIRDNLLEDFGGDGIVPRGCEGALIEHNVLRGGRQRCDDYAAGIWPYSSDNTVIQFNEVSRMKGTKDGMAFDSDGNRRNTTIQYNYSHDNDGGFVMICGGRSNVGNIVRYNVSQNDAHRLIYITGPVRDIQFYNNICYLRKGLDAWAIWPGGGGPGEATAPSGYAEYVRFFNNIFYFEGRGEYHLGEMQAIFEANVFFGNQVNPPRDPRALTSDPMLVAPGTGRDGLESAAGYQFKAGSPCIDSGVDAGWNGGRDFYGNVVPAGKVPNRGAFEFPATVSRSR